MSKIIIKNNTNLTDLEALEIVSEVVAGGKISSGGAMYCTVTIIASKNLEIYTTMTKNTTHIFTLSPIIKTNNN